MLEALFGYAIDWAATGSMLAGGGTLLGAVAIIYAAHKGADTFKQWRKQKHHERCMSVAEDVLTVVYKLDRAFEHIRSEGVTAGESEEAIDKLRAQGTVKEDTLLADISILSIPQITLARIEEHSQSFNELLDKIPVAKAIFGEGVAAAMQVFWTQRARIVSAAHVYTREMVRHPRTEVAQASQDDRRSHLEGLLWAGGAADGVDTVDIALGKSIVILESALLPILRAEPHSRRQAGR